MHCNANKTQDYLYRLQGYLMKVRDSFESLPSNNAYKSLSCFFYKTAMTDGVYIDDVKSALHDVARIASRHADYIEINSGVPKKHWQSKLTDVEIAIRMSGNYSHRSCEAIKLEKFSDNFHRLASSIFQKSNNDNLSAFLDECCNDLNDYFYKLWLGIPNKDDDIDKLNTLLTQVERVLDNIYKLIEIVIEKPFADPFAKDRMKNAMPILWKLRFSIIDVIAEINLSERKHKQLEFELIKELALNYKHHLKLNPSPDNRRGRFMEFISLLEDEMDVIANTSIRAKNRFGRLVVQKAIKEI